ncbi:MAG TPA: hypothetical protein VK013_16355 [Myxococcaceae bacterium]|nr:hypothetical protein [Myxococcaceae bacterium]
MSLRPLPLLMFGLMAVACQDPVDRAAKERIFSAEDPPLVITAAAEALDAQQLAEDPALAQRVLDMDAAEVVERLGPHVATSKLTFEWTGAEEPIRLEETRKIIAGSGGVSGDFQVVLDNSRDQGLEVLRKDNGVYARNRYGRFRQRLRDRGMAERVRSEVQGVVRDMNVLFNARLALSPKGTETFEGRQTHRYDLSLASEKPALPEQVKLPEPLEPKGGQAPGSLLRQRFRTARTPVSVSGSIWVDAQTAVILQAKVDGRLRVPGEEGQPTTELSVSVRSALSDIGKEPTIEVPEDFLPDADKPEGIAEVITRYGFSVGAAAENAGEAEGDSAPASE